MSSLAAVALCLCAGTALGQTHGVPYFSSASDTLRQGFVRVVNRDDEAGTVSIEAIDDDGQRFGPVTLSVGAGETVHFNSDDLEEGNAGKGLSSGIGAGIGDWRLELESALDLEVLAYLRTADGFLTAMHDVVSPNRGVHRVPIFNPASNVNQVSVLRLTNPGEVPATVHIVGIDGEGAESEAQTVVPAGASVTLTAQELEALGLGDGAGKWQLRVESDRAVRVVNLLRSPTGHLTNLSTAPANVAVDDAGAPVHTVALMPAAGSHVQGFVRVINHDDEAGVVTIHAIDDAAVDRGSLELALDAHETAHFNSADLLGGNAAKGLTGSIAEGVGDWRLELRSSLAIEVLAYARTRDGFLTSLHDLAPVAGEDHHVGVFNPGRNRSQVSSLRVVNPGDEAADVTIVGVDDQGETPGAGASTVVPAGAAVTYTVRELEEGTGAGLSGSIGVGQGKWRLRVTSRHAVQAMSLMRSPTGHVTNLSTTTSAPLVRRVPLDADIDIPPAVDSVSPGDVTVAALGGDGVEAAAGDASSLLIASDAQGTVMLAVANEDGGYLDEGPGTVEVGIESTAIVLVAVASGHRFTEIEREVAEAIRSHEDFGRLTRLLAGLMAADKNYLDRLYDYPEAVTLIKSVAAGVASLRADASAAAGVGVVLLGSRRVAPTSPGAPSQDGVGAAVADRKSGPIAARFKDDFYCVPGSAYSFGFIPCSPWHEHEPWRWYGDAEGVKDLYPDSFPEVVRCLAVSAANPAVCAAGRFLALGLEAATQTPFLAVSDEAVRGCRGLFCQDDGLHAIANPNFVNYAMELYDDGVYRDWVYAPRNATTIGKVLNSGAAYRVLRAGRTRTHTVHLSPAIDSIRFERYRFALAEGDEEGVDRGLVVSFMNTFHLVIAGANLVSDMSELRKLLENAEAEKHLASIMSCATEAAKELGKKAPDLIVDGRLVVDANPDEDESALFFKFFDRVGPDFLDVLVSRECTKMLAQMLGDQLWVRVLKGAAASVRQLFKSAVDTASLKIGVGFAKLAFDASNEAGPVALSYFRSAPGRVDYHLSWKENQEGVPYISAVSKSRPPQARFEYARRGGFDIVLDASATTPGDSDELAFEWRVNGQDVGRGERITHDFGAAGTYLVELVVTDGNGLAGTFSSGVEVTPGSEPIVSSLTCTATGPRSFRMVAAFSDVDGDIETVEWRSNAKSLHPDETTSAATTEVELTASRATAWASVSVVDAEENRATKVCTVDLEQSPSKKVEIDSATAAACGREAPWRACYHRATAKSGELVEFAISMPREPAGSWHGAWCVKEERQGLCPGQHDRLSRVDKRFADDAPLAFLARPPEGAETFWVVAEVRECDEAPCTWPEGFTEVEFHHIEVTVGDGPVEPGSIPGTRFRDCAECPEMVVIPAGSFMMGSPESEEGHRRFEAPVHRVTIAKPFAVGVYEVTFAEWDACHRAGLCSHNPDDLGRGRGRQPVTHVIWGGAQEYVRWLSQETGQRYRLLSESEWEYVARAGTRTRYWWGDEVGRNRANCVGCGSRWDNEGPAPVGSFSANGFGLHDVHGNVWEWVEDSWHDSYRGAPTDGSAWTRDSSRRVIRGGSWTNPPLALRSAVRNHYYSNSGRDALGFRVARSLD